VTEPLPSPPSWRERLDLLARPPKATPAQITVAAVGVVALAVVAWLVLREPPGPPPEEALPRAHPAAATSITSADVVVHAAGAVRSPGLYHLPVGARVDDLLRAAGGATTDADLDRINLAAPLTDGSRVYVPRVGEAAPPVASGGSGADASSSGPLDLNTATLEQLDALPGVGPATAKAIIDARSKRGRFTSVDDLLSVRGIGPAKLEAIRDLVSV
jgi:competence protein ComEA